jgi:isopentenyl diphosphate isomerase/L-lactate dehydrogenase-like FMN-dependent dehydrogenase
VERAVALLREELQTALALIGAPTVDGIGRAHVR